MSIRIYLDDEEDLAVLSNKAKPQNIAAATNYLLFSGLNSVNIEFVGGSYNRTLVALDANNFAACTLNKVKNTQREAKYLFSQPVNVYISRRLYQHASLPPLSNKVLNDKGEIISLAKLFQVYPEKLLVVSDTISYGVFYDQALAALDSKNKIYRSGSSYYETIHRMFESRRVDFILAFPVEVLRYGKNNQAMYKAYTVAGVPKSSIGHLMCNKHSHSEAFLKSINVALNKMYQQPEFLNAHLNFLPEQDHPQIKQLINQTISSIKLRN